jgi:hypothetical protein
MDLDQVRANAQIASTERLLDQVTVFREEMESAAVTIFEAELSFRGVSLAQIVAHAGMREEDGISHHPDGMVVRCSYCDRPAVAQQEKAHRLWGWAFPVLPRSYHLCREHREELPTDAYGRVMHFEEY